MLVEVVLFAALLFLLWQGLKKPSGLPPGRWGLPLVGHVPLTTRSIEDQLIDLHKQHGDIYLWRMGTQVMLFLHGHQLVKEAFSKPEFTDRPPWETFKLMENPALGIGATNGAHWHNIRRFTLRQLRDLGMGKSKMLDAVHEQATQLVEILSKQAGTPAPVPHALRVAVVNVIWQMVGGHKFPVTDPKLKELDDILNEFFSSFTWIAIQDFLPWLQHIMPTFLYNRLIRADVMQLTIDKVVKYFSEEVERHRATLNPDNPRDLIDGYLLDMEENKDDPESTCSVRDLIFLVIDLFSAGSETTTSTTTWMMHYLAANPHVQRKLHAEIDEVLPKGTLATLEDKARMPYTEAVINETLRHSSLTSLGVAHMASQDTTFGGYTIPKGTVINSVSFHIHRDPRYWDKPDQFLPERWLDQEGKFTSKKEGYMPFGIGKRVCVGESLGRMELFIFATTIFQSLSVAPPPGKTIDLNQLPGNPLFRFPKPQDILLTIRK